MTINNIKAIFDYEYRYDHLENITKMYYAGAFDFDGDAKNESHYKYNSNGSLIEDTGRGITFIEYDDFNNPKRIQFSNGNVTKYVYSADGEKLRTIHYTATANINVAAGQTHVLRIPDEVLNIDSTDYIGSLILKNGSPEMYLFSGGYFAFKDDAPGNINGWKELGDIYYYNYDHLGNVREVIASDGTLKQVNNYYPFGAPFSGDSISLKTPNFQPYKYTGKELDLVHGLNTYDHGARQNYSILGVWDRVDPMVEKYYNVSPYAVCGNNPIQKVDRNGKWSDIFTTLFYWSITSNSSIQYNKDAKSINYKWTINVFSNDKEGHLVITNHHAFDNGLKGNASLTLKEYSKNMEEISLAASSIGDGAEKGALISAVEAPEVATIAAGAGVYANKIGTAADLSSKVLNISSSFLEGNVDKEAISDVIYSFFTIITINSFQKKLKPFIKEILPNQSSQIENAIYDQLQELIEDARH